MDTGIVELRSTVIEKVLLKQDTASRWGYNEKQARERPETLYYSPNFKSTLWTLVLLADIQAPVDLPQAQASMHLIHDHFFGPEHSIFRLPEMIRFPIPCLNGNMIYLHNYFRTTQSRMLGQTIAFFAAHQRFDDGDFKTPKNYPYCSNTFCYGKHTCYWGVIKLFKGLSFIPMTERSREAQQLLENCIEFVLHHEVCYGSHRRDEFLHRDIGKLTFPNFYKGDFLELLWLLAREGVRDKRTARSLKLLRSKRQKNGAWILEKAANTIVPVGEEGRPNAFIAERASAVLDFYGG